MKSVMAVATVAAVLIMTGGVANAAFTAVGVYDEQTVQTNAVDYSMGYSSSSTWTTGIGQTLGDSQIKTFGEFKPMVESAFLSGMGGVVNFEHEGTMADASSFDVSFAGGTKQFTVTATGSNASSTLKFDETGGGRTSISGDDRLQGNDELIDLEFGNYVGFDTDEKIRAIGWTVLGRDGSANSWWRVVARYTNGTETGSSSTSRWMNMSSGNTTSDSFSGIVAPDGYWITGMRVHCDQTGVWTAHDDFAFMTVPEPTTMALLSLGALAVLKTRKRRSCK